MDVRVELKKAEHQRIDTFELWCWRTPESPLDCKDIQPVHPKGNEPWIFIGRNDVKLQYFGHPMWRTSSLEKTLMMGKTEGRRRRGQERTRWLDGITNSMDMSWSMLRDGEGQGSLVCCFHGSQWVRHDWVTEQLNNKKQHRWELWERAFSLQSLSYDD